MSPARIVTSITGSPGSPSSGEYFWFLSGSSRTGGYTSQRFAFDLEAEDVVRVVVHLEALRARGRVVRIRLHGMGELTLELAAELGEGDAGAGELEDDRRAALELRRDPFDLGAAENEVASTDVLRVVAEHDLRVFLDDPERG